MHSIIQKFSSILVLTGIFEGSLQCMDVKPQEKRVAGEFLRIKTIEVDKGNSCIRSLLFHPHPAVKTIFVGLESGIVQVLNRETGKVEQTFKGHTGSVLALAVDPSGTRALTGSADQTAHVWNVAEGKQLLKLTYETAVESVAFSSDGAMIAVGLANGTVHVYTKPLKKLLMINASEGPVKSIVFRANKCDLVTAGCEGTCSWKVGGGHALKEYKIPGNATARLVALNSGGDVLIAKGWDERVWLLTEKLIKELQLGKTITVLALSPDGEIIFTVSQDGKAHVWDATAGTCLQELKGHTKIIRVVTCNGDETMIASGSDGGIVTLWKRPSFTLIEMETNVFCVAFPPDGKTMLVGVGNQESGEAQLLNREMGKIERLFSGHASWVCSLAISPNGRLILTGSADNTARLWDFEKGELLFILNHDAAVLSVAFNPTEDTIVALACGGIYTWDAKTGDPKIKLKIEIDAVYVPLLSLACNPNTDEDMVATGSDEGEIYVWRLSTGTLLGKLKHSTGSTTSLITSVVFSPDGKTVFAGFWSKAEPPNKPTRLICVWDVKKRELLHEVKQNKPVLSLSFDPSRNALAIGWGVPAIILWEDPLAYINSP